MAAVNLTESWRLEHNGKNIKPINGNWNCDTRGMVRARRPWFRFSDKAGTKMLNTCPKSLSCGTAGSMWSDAKLPSTVGQQESAMAYTRYSGNCKHQSWPISVMRCSFDTPNDVIYRFKGSDRCANSFCGMN